MSGRTANVSTASVRTVISGQLCWSGCGGGGQRLRAGQWRMCDSKLSDGLPGPHPSRSWAPFSRGSESVQVGVRGAFRCQDLGSHPLDLSLPPQVSEHRGWVQRSTFCYLEGTRLPKALALVLHFDAPRHGFSDPNMRHKVQGVTVVRKFICPPTPTLDTGIHLVLTM